MKKTKISPISNSGYSDQCDVVKYSKSGLNKLSLPELDAMLKYAQEKMAAAVKCLEALSKQSGNDNDSYIKFYDHAIHSYDVMIELIQEARDKKFYSVFELPSLPVNKKK